MIKLIDITGKPLTGEWGTDDVDGNGIPVLRTTNFTNEGIVDFTNVVTRKITKKNLSEKYLRNGDIIIEKSGGSDKQPVGRVVFFEGEQQKYLFNNFTGLLRVTNTDKWLPRYVFYSLFAKYRAGGTLPYENRTTGLHNLQTDAYINSIEIKDISITQQVRLCSILDGVQHIIHFRQQELSALDDLIKARFVEMFGNPISNEKGFETKLGSDVFNLSNGKFVPENKRFEEGIPVYGGNGVSWYTDDILFENDTVVVGRVGFQSGNVHYVKGPLWISDNAMYINKIFDDGFDLRFLCFVMEHIDFTRYQDAGDLKKITQKPFMSMPYIKPPIDLQLEYIAFVAHVDKSKDTIKKSLAETQLLFYSLMQEYFG